MSDVKDILGMSREKERDGMSIEDIISPKKKKTQPVKIKKPGTIKNHIRIHVLTNSEGVSREVFQLTKSQFLTGILHSLFLQFSIHSRRWNEF